MESLTQLGEEGILQGRAADVPISLYSLLNLGPFDLFVLKKQTW